MRATALDRKLSVFREAAERISANLVELEIDPCRQLVEATALGGLSAERWSAASNALTELWRRHGLLEELVERAGELQRSRQADDLRRLLTGPSIELASPEVPLGQRKLLSTLHAAERCSADELISSMSTAFEEVRDALAAIDSAWDALIPELDAARRLHTGAVRLADELGEPPRVELQSAGNTLAALSAAVTTDPLSVDEGEVEHLLADLQAVRHELERCASLKRGLDARLLEARELLARLRTAEREAEDAHEELCVKISVPPPPAARPGHRELERQLEEIAQLAREGTWSRAYKALDHWSARTGALLQEALKTVRANRAPLQARNQFRALLEAYQVKARSLGLVEEPQLEETFRRAQDVLYNAPTDLALAAQLVRRYQLGVSGGELTSEGVR